DEGAADEDPRAADQSESDRFLESPVEPAGVANRRETGVEGGFDHVLDPQREHGGRKGSLGGGIEVDQRQVNVRVEQPGHQGAALAVDDPDVFGSARSAAGADAPDPPVLDDHARVALQIAAGAIEDGGVLEDGVHSPTSLST